MKSGPATSIGRVLLVTVPVSFPRYCEDTLISLAGSVAVARKLG